MSSPEPTHFPPDATSINNLTLALTAAGSPGVFNSSGVPNAQYGVYNWCNMPHVRVREYDVPPDEYVLQYVEVIQRHHKRTPYASNTFPAEDIPWTCKGSGAGYGLRNPSGPGKQTVLVQWDSWKNPTANPFARDLTDVGFGTDSTCAFPQITATGLEDSISHGQDLAAVYRHFLPRKYNTETVVFRVTNNVITSQVASGLVKGMFAELEDVSVEIQPSTFDSLEPSYSCRAADKLRTSITTDSSSWNEHLTASADVFSQLDAVSNIHDPSRGFGVSFDHYYDNLSAKQCHDKPLPCNLSNRSLCVSQDLANTVYRLGNWEYSHLYRDAPQSTAYSALRYGAFFLELKFSLLSAADGSSRVKYRHNIAHDGSVSNVLAVLQVSQMVWPGMGSEVVFELYKRKGDDFIRVLWNGKPMHTSTNLGTLDMVPLERFVQYIDDTVGSEDDLYANCN